MLLEVSIVVAYNIVVVNVLVVVLLFVAYPIMFSCGQ